MVTQKRCTANNYLLIVENNLHANRGFGVRIKQPHITKHAFAWARTCEMLMFVLHFCQGKNVPSLLAKTPFGETNISISFPNYE